MVFHGADPAVRVAATQEATRMTQELEPAAEQRLDAAPESQTIPDDLGLTLIVANDHGEVCLRDPVNGRELDGSATAEQLVEYRTHLAWVKRAISEAQDECDRRLVALMDRNALWTVHHGSVKASAPSVAAARKESCDSALLYATLTVLVEDGTITQDALDAAIETSTSYKVKARGVQALRRVPAVAAAIAGCFTETEVDRKVSLSGA